MVESKFAGILKNRIVATEASPQGRVEAPVKTGGRKRGKKSNPDYRLRSLLLRDTIHRTATDKVRDLDDGKDLSDVVNELLEQWTSRKT
jgi:hypothetical protein